MGKATGGLVQPQFGNMAGRNLQVEDFRCFHYFSK